MSKYHAIYRNGFICSPFQSLSIEVWYLISQLRESVFIVEQNVVYLDADGKDMEALHLFKRDNEDKLVAYARIFAPGIKYPEASIGRIVVVPEERGTDLGNQLINNAIAYIKKYFDADIRISAQAALKDYYNKYGFEPQGVEYIEDDIPHIEMLLKVKN